MNYTDGDPTASSPLHGPSGPGEGRSSDRRKCDPNDENLPISGEDLPEHYICVSYPPELKQRLLER